MCFYSTKNLIHIVRFPPGLIHFLKINTIHINFFIHMRGPPHRLSTFKDPSPLIHKMRIIYRFFKPFPYSLLWIKYWLFLMDPSLLLKHDVEQTRAKPGTVLQTPRLLINLVTHLLMLCGNIFTAPPRPIG